MREVGLGEEEHGEQEHGEQCFQSAAAYTAYRLRWALPQEDQLKSNYAKKRENI